MALQIVASENSDVAVITSAGAQGSGRRHITRLKLDRKLADQIYSLYYEKDSKIFACRETRYAHTFRGGLRVEWGSDDIKPVVLFGEDASDKAQVESFVQTSIDYRDMFGMCPVLYRRHSKKHAKRLLMSVPPYGSGEFVVEYNQKTLDVTVVYEVNIPGASQTRVLRLDVYVWPEYTPAIAISEGNVARFRSRIAVMMERYTRITSLRKHLIDADWGASHPMFVTQSRPDNRAVEEQTEQEILGLAGDPGTMGPPEKQRYTRTVHKAQQAEALVASLNASSIGGDAAGGDGAPGGSGAASAASTHQVVDPATGRMVTRTRGTFSSIRYVPLPADEELARAVPIGSRTDFPTLESRYDAIVCETMGVPEAYMSGVGAARIKGETDQLREVVRAAALKDRKDINRFFPWAYEGLNRGKDNAFLLKTLVHADDTGKDGEEVSRDERARLADVKRNLVKISKMPQRTRVVFEEDPLPRRLDTQLLSSAAKAGTVTRLEYANLYRGELGLPSISEDHELLRDDADAPAKPPIIPVAPGASATSGGAGGGGGEGEGGGGGGSASAGAVPQTAQAAADFQASLSAQQAASSSSSSNGTSDAQAKGKKRKSKDRDGDKTNGDKRSAEKGTASKRARSDKDKDKSKDKDKNKDKDKDKNKS